MRSMIRRIVGVLAILAFVLPWIEIAYFDWVDKISGLRFLRLNLTEGRDLADGDQYFLGIVLVWIFLFAIILLVFPKQWTALAFVIPSAIFLLLLYSEREFSNIFGSGIKLLLLATILGGLSFFFKKEENPLPSTNMSPSLDPALSEQKLMSRGEQAVEADKLFCIQCGQGLKPGVNFCSSCGEEVKR